MSRKRSYPRALGRDQLRWIDFGYADVRPEDALRQRRTARRIVRGLYRDAVPGMILGDEVGMGKTFETFGVIAALFRHQPRARVAVLTHSATMAREWRSRWAAFTGKDPDAEKGLGGAAFTPGVAVGLPDAVPLEGTHQLGIRCTKHGWSR